MRVAFFSTYTGLGGGETSLLALLGALDRDRLGPVLVCPRDGPLPVAARALGVEVRIVPWRGASAWFHPAVWARLPPVKRIADCLEAVGPASVHTEFHALPFVAPAARRLGLPVVFTCHGSWFRPKPWQRALYRQHDLDIVAVSEAVRAGFVGTPPWIDPATIEVVPLGVDTSVHRPRPDERQALRDTFGLPPAAPVVTLVARFQRVKGHDVFLDMARRLLNQVEDACFAIAGENVFDVAADESFKQEVVNVARSDPRLRDAVRFLGFVQQPERLISASDVVVCSSRFESFGMVPLEAMAAGVPVVSTDVGGPVETIVDGETGFLVAPGRPDLLADRVARLLADPTLRKTMGRAGRARVVDRFEVARYAARMTDILLDAPGARR